jgi:Fe2+ transport system protein FeoA
MAEPTAYRVRGALIALRREQTNEIEIEPLQPATVEDSR